MHLCAAWASLLLFTVSKQLANMLDAVLPELPAMGTFLDTIIEVSQKRLVPEKRGN